MAPKRARRQTDASSSQPPPDEQLPYDAHHFPLPAAHTWFINVIPHKKLVRERGLKLVQGLDDYMLAEVERRRWTQFIRAPEAAVIRIVKEFYSMLKATEKERTDYRVRFRGTWVSFAPDRINALYATSCYDGNVRLQTLTRRNLDPLDITNVICDGEVEWTMTKNGLIHKHFPLSCLSPQGLAWFKFVCCRLLPCMHVSDVTWERAVLVYAIMTRVPIDVGLFIYNAMMRTAYHRSSGLWFPSLITTLCREAGMMMDSDMEILPAGGYIIPIRHDQGLPPDAAGEQAFAGLSIGRQLAAMRYTQERWIRHEHEVHTQISVNLRRITDERGLEFSPFPAFPDDVFHVPGGAEEYSDEDSEDDGDGDEGDDEP